MTEEMLPRDSSCSFLYINWLKYLGIDFILFLRKILPLMPFHKLSIVFHKTRVSGSLKIFE